MDGTGIVETFVRELTSVQDCAANTVTAYRREVQRFETFLAGRGKGLLQAEREDFMALKEAETVRKPASLALTFNALRNFYGWLADDGHLPANPMPRKMRIRAKAQDPADVPTAEQFAEIRRLLAGDGLKRSYEADLQRLIVEVLAGSGLRISALLTLKPRHLRLGDRPIILVEADSMDCKGKTAGEVPLTPYAADLLAAYLKAHPMGFNDPIFKLSDWTVRDLLKKVSPKGLSLHPHSLRHFYCSMTYYRNMDGGRRDAVWVRDAAGHSSIATTDRYLKQARRVCRSDEAWEIWANGKASARKARSA